MRTHKQQRITGSQNTFIKNNNINHFENINELFSQCFCLISTFSFFWSFLVSVFSLAFNKVLSSYPWKLKQVCLYITIQEKYVGLLDNTEEECR